MPSQHAKKSLTRSPPPLDAAALEALALAYVARFATSAARLDAYLARKLRARGWDGPDPVEVCAELVARFVAAGYLDDAAYAQMRSGGLQRRGYGRRHIAAALGQAGIAPDIAVAALPDARAARLAALALARKRRLGPFGPANPERAIREKQIAILLRAGHRLDSARDLVNAPSIEAAENWASEEC